MNFFIQLYYSSQGIACKTKNLLLFFIYLFILSCSYNQALAQCNSNTIFKEDFTLNSTAPVVGNNLPNGITTYTFNGRNTITDGEYSIRKTTANLATGQREYGVWHTAADHTGDGYMMIVNASVDPGKFYEQRVDNLCAGSTLFFSAWIANLLILGTAPPLDPDVKFEITSTVTNQVLGAYTTGTIPRFSNMTWQQYGFNLTLPAGETSIVLRIYNNQVGGGGNDLAIDDISFSLCGAISNPEFSGTYLNANTICSGLALTLSGNVDAGVYTTPVYQWQNSTDSMTWANIAGATTKNYSKSPVAVSDSKWYRLLIAETNNINAQHCRTVSPVLKLMVYDPVMANIIHQQPVCEKDTLQLSLHSPALQYQWTGPNNFASSDSVIIFPSVSTSQQGLYALKIISNGGCTANGSTLVTILPNRLSTPLPDKVLLCNEQTVTYSVNNPNIISWSWSTGDADPSLTIGEAGLYWLNVSDGVCSVTDTVIATAKNRPEIHLGRDTTICSDEHLILDITNTDTDFYIWQDNSTNAAYTVKQPGLYTVSAQNECGVTTDNIYVKMEPCLNQVFVPTAFTPNNDLKNDVLRAKSFFPVEDFVFTVYNRWGQQVFQSNNIQNGWNGYLNDKRQAEGLYIWRIQYRRRGNSYHDSGSVTLLY